MSSVLVATDPDARPSAILMASVPVLAAAAVNFVLRKAGGDDISTVADVASALTAAVTSAPLTQHAIHRDKERALRSAEFNGPSLDAVTPSSPNVVVPSSTATVALAAVLAAAVFWLIDVLTSMFGWGSLGFFGGEVPSTHAEQFRAAAIRGLPFQIGGVFLIAVWLSHRLRHKAGAALNLAVLLYVLAVIATNVVLTNHAQMQFIAEDVYLPILAGVATFVTCLLGYRYANRTQACFDVVRAARLQWEMTSGRRR
jgi:hypothetical protein